MDENEKEEALRLMEDTANMLRGMMMDPTVPSYTREAMGARVKELEAFVTKYV